MSVAMSADQVRLLDRLLDQRKLAPKETPIPRRDSDQKHIPLSFAQQRIWFVHRLQPASTLYNGAGTARLRGRLDVDVLRRCIAETIRRHEILRTTYQMVNGRPVQRVGPSSAVALTMTDLTGRPPGERAAAARGRRNRLLNQPFDLERDMPLRAELLRLAPDEHWLVLAVHHIAGDGWSLGVFQREMAALYSAFLRGRPSPLPEPSLQYADFALWQRERSRGDAEHRELEYWREKLQHAPLLDLPTPRPRRGDGDQDGSAVIFDLPPGLTRSLSRAGESEHATLYMVLLAALAVVFSRWSGQRDLVIGSPIANRDRLDLEDLIGCFVNTLPLRIDTSGDLTFRSLLRRIRRVCLDAYAHQGAPFERIVEYVNPERGAGEQAPLIRHMFGLDNAPRPAISLPDLDFEFDVYRPEKARFDIEWVLNPTHAGGIGGRVWYATDLFDESSMARLLASLRAALTAGAADPDVPIARMPILAGSERARLLERFSGAASGTAGPRPADYAAWMADALGFGPGEVALYLGPLDERAQPGELAETAAAVSCGGRAVLADPARAADPRYLADLLVAERPSVIFCTPSQAAALLAGGLGGDPAPRHLLLGGEQPWPGLLAECRRLMPATAVWSLCRCGGLPVAAGLLSVHTHGDPPGGRLIGRPIAGAVLYVLDEHTELVPIGVPGELYIASPGAAPAGTGERARWLANGMLEMLGPVSGTGQPSALRSEADEIRHALLSHPMVDRAEVSGQAAYFSLRHDEVSRRSPRALFEERYTSRSVEDDPALNPVTWTSPSTGTQVTAENLRAWSDSTVRRVLALRPRRLLEIGCRNGLLLLRLAPHCEHYCATDLSARALAHIRESKDWVAGREGAIQLLRQAPDDVGSLAPESFDLVLISSLTQYSPGLEYLEQMITGAARVVRPGGAILVSDVRSLSLLPALHIAAICRSAPGTPLAELRQLLADRIDGESELTVDPSWFAARAARLPGIADVSVLARSGPAGELTGYRYDVLLRVGGYAAEPVHWIGGAASGLLAGQIEQLLAGLPGRQAGIRDVADGSVLTAARAAELLADNPAGDAAELWERAAAHVSVAITIDDLRAAASRAGYGTVLAGPAASAVPGLLDVVVSQAPVAEAMSSVAVPGPTLPGPLGHANDVRHAERARAAVPLLRGHLRERLPAHMIPELVVRRAWPVGPAGVLTPGQLPRPRQAAAHALVQRPPTTETERAIARIWADVLGIDQVAAEDDFFALGGHSLLAAEIADRIRSELGIDLPLGRLFEGPTVASVAAYLQTAPREAAALPAIRRIDRVGYRRATRREED